MNAVLSVRPIFRPVSIRLGKYHIHLPEHAVFRSESSVRHTDRPPVSFLQELAHLVETQAAFTECEVVGFQVYDDSVLQGLFNSSENWPLEPVGIEFEQERCFELTFDQF